METTKATQYRRGFILNAFLKNKITYISGAILAVIITGIIFAPLIAPYPPNAMELSESFLPMSADHWFGTDKQGRDIFSRILYGGRTTILGGLLVVILAYIVGVPLGLVSGFFGGRIDNFIMRILDVVLAFPSLLLAFIIIATFGRGYENAVIALAIVYIPMIARIVRSVTLVEKEKSYTEAAKVLGYSRARVIFRHILPNSLSLILVQGTLDLAYAILDLAALSFLGFGVQPPHADWGNMLADGRNTLLFAPNLALSAGIFIMIVVICFNLFGDGLREHFDPKERLKR